MRRHAAAAAIIITVLPFATWILYLAIMTLYRAEKEGKLPQDVEPLGRFVLAVGYVADAVLNLVIGTLLFMELPREWLLSPRVERLQRDGSRYRKAVAGWICKNLLDWADPSGCHCK